MGIDPLDKAWSAMGLCQQATPLRIQGSSPRALPRGPPPREAMSAGPFPPPPLRKPAPPRGRGPDPSPPGAGPPGALEWATNHAPFEGAPRPQTLPRPGDLGAPRPSPAPGPSDWGAPGPGEDLRGEPLPPGGRRGHGVTDVSPSDPPRPSSLSGPKGGRGPGDGKRVTVPSGRREGKQGDHRPPGDCDGKAPHRI